jgi:hypothetical protein
LTTERPIGQLMRDAGIQSQSTTASFLHQTGHDDINMVD